MAVFGRPYYFRDWGAELCPRDMSLVGFRLFGQYPGGRFCGCDKFGATIGWWMEASQEQPGNHRMWFTYCQTDQQSEIDRVAKQAGQAVIHTLGSSTFARVFSAFQEDARFESHQSVLPHLPEQAFGLGSYEGMWRDIVSHVALRHIPQAPIDCQASVFGGRNTNEDPEFPLFRHLLPTDWIGLEQPSYSVVTIPEFCRASVLAIDVILEGWEPDDNTAANTKKTSRGVPRQSKNAVYVQLAIQLRNEGLGWKEIAARVNLQYPGANHLEDGIRKAVERADKSGHVR